MYLFKLLISMLSFVSIVQAAETQVEKYTSMPACLEAYPKLKTQPKESTAAQYCADKVMSPSELCIDNKVKEYLANNKYSSVKELINSDLIALQNKSRYECDVVAKQGNAAEVAAAQNAKASGGDASGYKTGANITKIAGIVASGKAGKAWDKLTGDDKAAKSAAAGPAAAVAGAAPGGAAASGAAASAAPAANASAAAGSESTKVVYDDGSSIETVKIGNIETKTIYNNDNSIHKIEQVDTSKVAAEAEAAKAEIGPASEAARASVPGASSQIEGVQDAVNNPKSAVAEKSELTLAATKIKGTIESSSIGQLEAAIKAADLATLNNTVFALESIHTMMGTYLGTTKTKCVSSADTAGFLCAEGTSKGAIAAKALINKAGPILSLVSSAQKTCSSTSDILRVAGLGLTVAKGACVASKLYCDVSCKTATADVEKIKAALVKLNANYVTEVAAISKKDCTNVLSDSPFCTTTLPNANKAVASAISTLTKTLASETSPTPLGTTGSVVAKCQTHLKDIALFSLQLYGTYASQKNAQNCAEQLAASSGGGMSMQAYCDAPENAAGQICKCQKTPTAEGCPGAVVAKTSASAADEKGFNLKASNGASAFATGGIKPVTPANNLTADGQALGSLKIEGSSASTTAAQGQPRNNEATGFSSGFGGEAGSASHYSGDSGSHSGANGENTQAEKKKWSFGSFLGGGGSDGSNSASGSRSSASKGAGVSKKFDAKTTEQVQRQIASEKISTEVSSASGKTNWEKVRSMYIFKEGSFLSGQ